MTQELVPSLGFRNVVTTIVRERFITDLKAARGRDDQSRYTIAAEPVTAAARRHIVVLIHGSNTLGTWSQELEKHLAEIGSGIDVRTVAFEPLQLWKVPLLPWSSSRLQDIDAQICSVIDDALCGDEISIVAHSYGTQLLMRWLNWRRGTKFKNVILLGSIVKRKWLAAATSRMDKTFNFVAVRDTVVCFAEAYAGAFYEATGAFGVRQSIKNLRNYYVDADHNDIVTVPFLKKYVLPIIDGRGLPAQRDVPRSFDHHMIWKMRRRPVIVAVCVAVMAAFLAWWSWR